MEGRRGKEGRRERRSRTDGIDRGIGMMMVMLLTRVMGCWFWIAMISSSADEGYDGVWSRTMDHGCQGTKPSRELKAHVAGILIATQDEQCDDQTNDGACKPSSKRDGIMTRGSTFARGTDPNDVQVPVTSPRDGMWRSIGSRTVPDTSKDKINNGGSKKSESGGISGKAKDGEETSWGMTKPSIHGVGGVDE
jgi:hypothetical protein